MDNDYSKIHNLRSVPRYLELMRSFSVDVCQMSCKDIEYLLSLAIVLVRTYENDKRLRTHLELAYYIILRYSLSKSEYQPLYDFSTNFGFFPISRVIYSRQLLGNKSSIFNAIVDASIEDVFQDDQIVETKEQHFLKNSVLSSLESDVAYVAPTSFGKSSVIIKHIEKNINLHDKFCILVPSKSLLLQTYKKVKESHFERKIIVHDEMYSGEERLIAVLTQERAMRLLEKNNIAFDVIYVDEAHNMLERDFRSILLSRVIKLNRKRNPHCQNLFFSPLVEKTDNLNLFNGNRIFENRVCFNVKEPIYYRYTLGKELQIYNRFIDEFVKKDSLSISSKQYILQYKKNKSFCFLYSPKKIEMFAKSFADLLPTQNSREIEEIIEDLKDYVHKDFWGIDCVRKGLVYLHAKIPDRVKEYLEQKYKDSVSLSFLVANTVVLEGVNLPIDTLFLLSVRTLDKKTMTNLIGRVNRLDYVFGNNPDLTKLMPEIHFVENEDMGQKSFENKIHMLKSSFYKDDVCNPLLENFNPRDSLNRSESSKEECERIKKDDEIFFKDECDDLKEIKRKFLSYGIAFIFRYSDAQYKIVLERLNRNECSDTEDAIECVYEIFISSLDAFIDDNSFKRLSKSASRNFYKRFVNERNLVLRERLHKFISYFKYRISNNDPLYYVGDGYGEVKRNETDIKPNYVDLSSKTDKELVNLAIVRQKVEEDFVSYTLTPFFQILHEYDVLSDKTYNEITYGTNDPEKISLERMGLTIDLINRLEKDGQLENVGMDSNGMLTANENFEKYRQTQKGIYRFELDKWF